jgi:pimeloyl-ACP methyl ester carboxylesterase
MAPSGIELTLKKILPKIFYYLIFPTDKKRKDLIDWFLGNNQKVRDAFDQQISAGMQQVPKVPIPLLISLNKLKKIKIPVMVMLGENDPAITADKALQRVKSHIPDIKTVLIPGVGHVINYEAGEQVESLMINFLGI